MNLGVGGLLWDNMSRENRRSASDLRQAEIPKEPGVYAWFREGLPIYVGKASSLRRRVGGNHLGKGVCLTGSAFRRNVAEHLGIATSADIKAKRREISRKEADAIGIWISNCQVTWIVCDSEFDACSLEDRMKQEYQPPLTKL